MRQIEAETPEKDWLPEACHYHDEGCDLAPSCLGCPFPLCRYDEPGELQRQARGTRDRDLLRLRRQKGMSLGQLARRFGISTRTVHRILRRGNHE